MREPTPKITRRTLADIYLLSELAEPTASEDYARLAAFCLYEIKTLYLSQFRTLMVEQLDRYTDEERTEVKNYEGATLAEFPELFLKTYRSRKPIPNFCWVELAKRVVSLQEAETKPGIIKWLDAINYSLHNSPTFVLSKLPYGRRLCKMLNEKFIRQDKSTAWLLPYASAEVKELYIHREGKNVRKKQYDKSNKV